MTARSQLWVTLTVLGRDTVTWAIPPGESIMIGRDESANDLLLHHPNVSRTHARLVSRGDGYAVMDLGSTKGTLLNGARVATVTPISDGDRLDIGPYALRLAIKPWRHAEEDDASKTINDTRSIP